MHDTSDHRLPVCLLTGFLGAGKSTLLNFVLRHPQMRGTAVVINEYGSVGVDHHLVESAPDHTALIADGCLCCTASGRLSHAMLDLFTRAQERGVTIRRIVIETTGLAEPGPILMQLMNDHLLTEHFVVDSVVTLVDALNASSTLAGLDTAVAQIAGADRLLITKADLVDVSVVSALERTLSAMNPDAKIERVVHGAAHPIQLFSGAHRRITSGDEVGLMFANAEQLCFTPSPLPPGRLVATGRAPSEHDIQTFSLVLEEPIPASTLSGWLAFLRTLCGPTLLRVKGLVNLCGQEGPTVIHGVQQVFHPLRALARWPDQDRRTRLVFITRGWGQEIVGSTLDWLQSRATTSGAGCARSP